MRNLLFFEFVGILRFCCLPKTKLFNTKILFCNLKICLNLAFTFWKTQMVCNDLRVLVILVQNRFKSSKKSEFSFAFCCFHCLFWSLEKARKTRMSKFLESECRWKSMWTVVICQSFLNNVQQKIKMKFWRWNYSTWSIPSECEAGTERNSFERPEAKWKFRTPENYWTSVICDNQIKQKNVNFSNTFNHINIIKNAPNSI